MVLCMERSIGIHGKRHIIAIKEAWGYTKKAFMLQRYQYDMKVAWGYTKKRFYAIMIPVWENNELQIFICGSKIIINLACEQCRSITLTPTD